MTETRKLAAILAADVVGYSKLAGSDEDRTLSRLRGLRSDLVDPAIAAHHGRVVKRTGNGSFDSYHFAALRRTDALGRAYRPVTKRAIMTMVSTCIVPCMPTAKKKLRIIRLTLTKSGSGRRNWMQTRRLVGNR